MPTHSGIDRCPWWAWVLPMVGLAAVVVVRIVHFPPLDSFAVTISAAVLLFTSVFAAVHHAEIVALRVGEPLGSIVLAIAVTVIEVGMIVSLMFSATDGGGALARDTVFAAVMLVLNGVVGLCLVLGGARHGEQSFREHGAAATLSVLGTLAAITLVLPNFTRTTPGPVYAPSQLLFVGIVALVLYAVFLFVQTIRHRDYFLTETARHPQDVRPGGMTTAISAALLVVSLASVVLLAKILSPALERAVGAAGLPRAFVGVLVATIVLLPEGTAAIRAAWANELQTSLNLALGSAMASIALTIPTVAALSLAMHQPLTLGLGSEEMVLLILTLFIGTVTLATGRTTILQGAVHLVILAVFLLLSAIP